MYVTRTIRYNMYLYTLHFEDFCTRDKNWMVNSHTANKKPTQRLQVYSILRRSFKYGQYACVCWCSCVIACCALHYHIWMCIAICCIRFTCFLKWWKLFFIFWISFWLRKGVNDFYVIKRIMSRDRMKKKRMFKLEQEKHKFKMWN